MSRFTIASAVILSLPLIAVAQVSTDAWDVAQGTVITDSSGGTPRNMFGAMDLNFGSGAVEPGIAFMDDGGRNAGFVHFVEFKTPAPVALTGYHLLAGDDDANNPGDRGFTLFSLYYFNTATSSYQLLDQFTPASNPYPNNSVDVTHAFPEIVADKFRVEFTQFATGSGPGPRIVELDAITVPLPEPSSLVLLASTLPLLPRRKRTSSRPTNR